MRRLNRYLGTTVLAATAGALLVLVSLLAISNLVSEIGDLEGDYDFLAALSYVALNIPANIYDYLSYGTFLGCVIGLGVHANANELVILRASGVSLLRIGWAVMRPVMLVVVLGFLWGEHVTPRTSEMAENMRAAALGEMNEEQEGVWHREGDEFIFLESARSDGQLQGVTRYRFDEAGRMLASIHAQEGYYRDGYWELREVREARFGDGGVTEHRYEERTWESNLTPEQLKLLLLEPETLATRELLRYAQLRESQGLENRSYWLSFWRKVLQPVTIAGLVLVGISFIFGSLRESTMGFRMTVAILVGIVFEMVQNLLGSASVALGFSPLVAVLVPTGISVTFGAWLLNRN